MENIYLILVIVLFALAISDLIVGVSNDAVNFLNSAIGAKAAPFKVIMGIAALGILVGTTFSSGMMEVARKGIFHPEHFYFSEIMIIFLAVMLTDIILLDAFNTFGMPTSTTVSIVFELLGASVAVALVKIGTQPEAIAQIQEVVGHTVDVGTFINTSKAVLIVTGILLSVVIAFSIGALVQYLSRLIFSFNYDKNLKYYGAIWGGLAITAITYFILIKGIKGSTFSKYEMPDGLVLKDWVKVNSLYIMGYSFIAWSIILKIFQIVKIDILKVIVFVGTFAIAMAFAGNDLVNFIGVPLAGYHAYQDWMSSGADASTHLMSGLTGKVPTEYYLLVIAGLIMVITLWISKKARAVIKTSLDLSSQSEGEERFGSSIMARNMVRSVRKSNKALKKILPNSVNSFIETKFDSSPFIQKQAKEKDPPVFDMLRASVNLVVASILISVGTSFKLPLSTTYVTFMVAMGTSLADRAWDKESAVFRITGVISVIGGWFFTAFSAFTVAFLVGLLFSYAGFYAMFAMMIVVVGLVVRSYAFAKKKEKEKTTIVKEVAEDNVLEECTSTITDTLTQVSGIFDNTILGLKNDDRKLLKSTKKDVDVLNKQAKYLKDNIYKTLQKFDEDSINTSHYYVQVLDYLRETAHDLTFIVGSSYDHIENNFGELLEIQITELNGVATDVKEYYKQIIDTINTKQYENVRSIIDLRQNLINEMNDYRTIQIRRVKHKEAGTKNSILYSGILNFAVPPFLFILYLGILHEVKNLLLNGTNLLKSQRDLDDYKKK